MYDFDIAVIGAGSAGPKAARVAASSGKSVVIFEEALIGGECLYTGCVPSKAVIHSANLWHRMQNAYQFGLPKWNGGRPDFSKVMENARLTIDTVGAGSAVESFAKAGITTICEKASFIDSHTVITSKTNRKITANHFILCTGSQPAVPSIDGLGKIPYHTNQTIFNITSLPARLAVLGGGPIGCELGQVFARFGSKVTLIHSGLRLLAKDDADAASVLAQQFESEGIRVLTDTKVVSVEIKDQDNLLTLNNGSHVICDAVLIATGRRSNVDGLGLENAGVEFINGRLKTSLNLQTNVPHIWAAGDITTEYKFTHVVSYEGAVAALNAVASMEGRPLINADYRVIPRVTYTDPEVASVGLTPALARVSYKEDDLDIARFSFSDLDKAIILGETVGFVQIVSLKSDGTILGAQIVGTQAGNLISEICLAMRARLSVMDIALTMHAYPTMPEAVEAAAYRSCHAPLSPNIPREMGD